VRRGVRGDLLHGAPYVGRDASVEARPDVLRHEPRRRGERQGERQERLHRVCAPRMLTATMLLRRPNPSSIAGAAGSETQRSPSTTKAYWCWPTGSARVVVHTPLVPARASGAAFRFH